VEVADTLVSCDRFLGCGFVGKTQTIAGTQIIPIEAEIRPNRLCYSPDEEVEFTIKVKSAGATVNNVFLNINITDTATLVGGIVFPAAFSYTAIPGGESLGCYSFENLTLTAGVEYLIRFRVKMPPKISLPFMWVQQVDGNGDPMYDIYGEPIYIPSTDEYINLDADFEFFSNTDDPCLQRAFSGANGSSSLPLCVGRNNIIVNKNITTRKR
jgi:hypothetical protein